MTDRANETGRDMRYEVVYTANGEAEANGIRTVLEAAGIPCEIRTEAAARLFPVTVDGLGAFRILVPDDCLDEARQVLDNPPEPATSDD